MAKLNKQEVNAIANKIVRELTEKAKQNRIKYVSEYVPSPNYTKAETLINEYLELSEEVERITTQREKIYNKLGDLLYSLGFNRYLSVSKEILNKIIDKEYKVKEIPSVESLKEDIVIAGIDNTFDVEKFINDKLTEYIPRSLDITGKI